MEEKLDWLDKMYLSNYEQKKVDSEIIRQEPFVAIKEVEIPYSIASNESEADNTYLSYNKVIGTSLDKELYLAFQILDYALLSAPGAPLKTALVDAGIGNDIMGSYDNGIYQPIFSVIAQNANLNQKEAFIKKIETVLSDIVKNGMDKKALAAGINYHEFRYREADFGHYPKGLMYGLQILDSWLYDDEKPFIHVEAIDTLRFLKEKVNTDYFERLIQTYLLDNTHGSIVIVKPEKGGTAKSEKALEEKLKAYKDGLSDTEVEALVVATEKLIAYQEEPSTVEDLEKIPVLRREDISKDIAPIYNVEHKLGNVKMVHHEVETNGIGYVDFMFDLSCVSAELLPYVSILQSMLGIIDTAHYEYGELFNEINIHTGGIGTSLELYPNVTKAKEKEFKATFEIKTKALYEKLPVAFDMIREIILESKLDDEKRLAEILAMAKSRMQMRFLSSGNAAAVMRAMSYASPLSRFKDMTNGIEFYQMLSNLDEHFETEKKTLIENLQKLVKMLFRPDNMMLSYTSAKEGLVQMQELTDTFVAALPSEVVETKPCVIHCKKKNEGFKTSSKVQYVARAGNFMEEGLDYTGTLQILKVILGYDYLWQNIRVKGGAYGCMNGFNRMGEGYFVSYRDPNLEKTNEVYEGVVAYLEGFSVSERDMTKYIIGTMSDIDQPMTPAAKGDRSMNLYMNHVSKEMIEQERNEILHAGQEDIRALSKVVKAVLAKNQLCVIGSEEKIEAQKTLFDQVKDLF